MDPPDTVEIEAPQHANVEDHGTVATARQAERQPLFGRSALVLGCAVDRTHRVGWRGARHRPSIHAGRYPPRASSLPDGADATFPQTQRRNPASSLLVSASSLPGGPLLFLGSICSF